VTRLAPATRIALAIVVAVVFRHPAVAGLPDWAKPIAASAPEVPSGSPQWPTQTLFGEVRVTVGAGGGVWRVHVRVAEQYLSNRVDATQVSWFNFQSETMKMKTARGWHIPPGERAHRNVGGAIDIAMSTDFESDAKSRAIALEGVKKGSLVFTEFDAEEKPYTLSRSFPFGRGGGPVALDRVIVELPPGWSLRHAWLRTPGVEPAHSGNTWTFELRDRTPPEAETLGPDPDAIAPRLVVAMIPPDGTSAAATVLRDWNDLAAWLSTIAKGRDQADAATEKATHDALAAAGQTPLDRIRALALFVRGRVRYVAREVGIGGYAARPAGKTLADLNGDCKDKGTLLRAMIATAGFPSYPILINATQADTVADAVPDPGSFNHFVVGVLWPKDAPIPAEAAAAIVEVPELGKLLVVDTTDEYAWPGILPANLAGHRGLLVADQKGYLVTMPAGTPATHRIETRSSATVRADRSATVTLRMRYFGWPAEGARAAYGRSAINRRKSVEDEARAVWSGAEIKEYSAIPEEPDGAYAETLTLELPAGAPELGDGAVPLFPGAAHGLRRVPVAKRTVPVIYPHPLGLRYESAVDGVAELAVLPTAEKKEGDGWAVVTTFDRKGTSVTGTLTLELSRTRFEPDAFPELKQLWSATSRAAGPRMTVR
jgi:hypothetical protein